MLYTKQILLTKNPIPLFRNTLLILVGPSGSGKSTFAKQYFPSTMTVSTDHCRAMISDSSMNQRVSDHAFDLFYFIIEKRLLNGYPALADSTALRCKYRFKLQSIAQKYLYHTMLLLFDLPKEVCLANDKNRRAQVGENVLDRQWYYLEQTKQELVKEYYDQILVFHSLEDIGLFSYQWQPPVPAVNMPPNLPIEPPNLPIAEPSANGNVAAVQMKPTDQA